ncbi:uncharacterized protein LOC124140423 [Haliotis rufescens]|uniref:uncharacterized protein LOC124140423 n=1 Tax=Haliotis rufescens TaxID=6454 RepID=UPI001EB052BF|nr:uncharacterized protein LOC124140423 [Haliotis rufescens]
MKLALLVLVLLPLVYCDSLIDQFKHLFDFDELKSLVQKIADTVGSDPVETACEAECTTILHSNALLTSGCDLICRSFQSLVQRFQIV